MPAEKGFDPVPEAPEDQAEEKNRGGIIPPFPTEPVDRVPLGIMAPEESEQDGQQDSQAAASRRRMNVKKNQNRA